MSLYEDKKSLIRLKMQCDWALAVPIFPKDLFARGAPQM